MPIQLIGSSGAPSQIETNTAALRVVARPDDVGALGAYSVVGNSGTMAAALAAGSPIYSLRYGGANLALIKRVLFSAITLGTGFTAGSCIFQLIVARSFTASDSGGTSILPALNKYQTSFGGTGVSDIRIASTGTLTAGTRTLDGQPLAGCLGVASATASTVIVPAQTPMLNRASGDWPLVLATNEGFVIQATVAATGTWAFAVQVDWEEVSTYGANLAQ